MKHEYFWVMCAAASTALALIVGAAGAAVAQRPAQATVVGQRASDAGLSMRVSYRDLNLASLSGERTLNHRVSKAISFVCEPTLALPGLDFAYRDCQKYAADGARPQVALAIERAREIAMTGTSSIPAVAIAIAVR